MTWEGSERLVKGSPFSLAIKHRKQKENLHLNLLVAFARVEPAGAVTLAAGFLVAGSRGEAGGALFPVNLCNTANHAGAAFSGGDLGALAADHFRGVRDGSAAGADGDGLGFFVQHGKARSTPIGVLFRVLFRVQFQGSSWRRVQCLMKNGGAVSGEQ